MTKKERVLNFFICIICLSAIIFSVLKPAESASAAVSALSLCAIKVVPSLFLFMTTAKILSKCGADKVFSKITHGRFEKLFGVSESGGAAIFLGLISGYPAGALVIGDFLRSGKMKKEEAERILPFITAASPAFLVGTVGGICKSTRFGVILLVSQTLSSLALILMLRKKRMSEKNAQVKEEHIPIVSAVTSSVKECGAAVINVCSFVTFFYIFSYMTLYAFPDTMRNGIFGAVVAGICEVSCGFSKIAGIASPWQRYFFGGLLLGFAGISVFMQTADVLCACGVSMKKYLIGKSTQAFLCGIISFALGSVFDGGHAVHTFFIGGSEHGKIIAIWELALTFMIFSAVILAILAIILKFWRKFLKK